VLISDNNSFTQHDIKVRVMLNIEKFPHANLKLFHKSLNLKTILFMKIDDIDKKRDNVLKSISSRAISHEIRRRQRAAASGRDHFLSSWSHLSKSRIGRFATAAI
jgi:hypothetical protein